MKVAVVGCGHGELDNIYAGIKHIEQTDGVKIDLLLVSGDFQSVRNESDLACMACPPKYRAMNTFYKYYKGECEAPVPTIFIGGNHEASNYLLELFHGGWVAKNIFFLGFAGVVNFGGLRIGGVSGIFDRRDTEKGHYECPPFDDSAMRTIYHVREYETFKLLQLDVDKRPLDIFLSHDWPTGIHQHGDTRALINKKRFLEQEIKDNSLGNPMHAQLLTKLKPRHWFSAHLHVKFAAVVHHPPAAGDANAAPTVTKFLALDKCLPHRPYLQVINFPDANGPRHLSYDAEWLAIVKSSNALLNLTRTRTMLPPLPPSPSQAKLDFIMSLVARHRAKQAPAQQDGDDVLAIPQNFTVTAPAYEALPHRRLNQHAPQPGYELNPQHSEFCDMLAMDDLFARTFARTSAPSHIAQSPSATLASAAAPASAPASADPSEIDLDSADSSAATAASSATLALSDPQEISLDDDGAEGVPAAVPASAAASDPQEISLDDDEVVAPTPASTVVSNPDEIELVL